jgi:hypothetical protein
MPSIFGRYQRIAPFYDPLDFPFEHRRYHHLRPQLIQGLSGRILDAGVGPSGTSPITPRARPWSASTSAQRCRAGRIGGPAWAYRAGFDRHIEKHVAETSFDVASFRT